MSARVWATPIYLYTLDSFGVIAQLARQAKSICVHWEMFPTLGGAKTVRKARIRLLDRALALCAPPTPTLPLPVAIRVIVRVTQALVAWGFPPVINVLRESSGDKDRAQDSFRPLVSRAQRMQILLCEVRGALVIWALQPLATGRL